MGRVIAGMVIAGAVAAAVTLAPALGATEQRVHAARRAPVVVRGLDSFTPAAADPRLAALIARSGLGTRDFQVTPADSPRSDRAVTVAIRTRSSHGSEPTRVADSAAPTVGLAPIAYNLGMGVGWKRFAVTGDVNRVDLAGQPGSREAADVALSYSTKRVTGRVSAAADRPLDNEVRGITDLPSYSVDIGGSYKLTNRLDVTAGVRYRSDRTRLTQVDDARHDSQAVYVGTAFRF